MIEFILFISYVYLCLCLSVYEAEYYYKYYTNGKWHDYMLKHILTAWYQVPMNIALGLSRLVVRGLIKLKDLLGLE